MNSSTVCYRRDVRLSDKLVKVYMYGAFVRRGRPIVFVSRLDLHGALRCLELNALTEYSTADSIWHGRQ